MKFPQTLSNLLKPREKFLLLEISPRGTTGSFLNVDEDRNLTFEKRIKDIDLKKFFTFSRAPMRSVSQKAWEGKPLFKSHRKVIVAADSALATTIPIPLELVRDLGPKGKEKITLAELENLIAQAMAKIFNGCRTEAANRLGIHELDTILVGLKARDFKVDGTAAVSPVGFSGKKITLVLELTFTTRKVFEELKQFFNSPDTFFFAEASQAHLAAIARVRKLPLSVVSGNAESSSLYILEEPDGQTVLYREKFDWNFDSFFRLIVEEMGVSEELAKDLYENYLKKDMSETAVRSFKKTIQPALDAFWEEIGKRKLRGFVYTDMPHKMPFELPYRHGGATFEEHPLGEILAELGFSVDPAIFAEDPNGTLRSVLYFLEAYFDKSNSAVNQKLRRRLHWLAD